MQRHPPVFTLRLEASPLMVRNHPVLSLLLTLCVSVPASAQTTTTNCNGYGNTLNCTSNTRPSLEQQRNESMQQFQESMAQLGAAIAQRRAAKAAQQAIWAAAATEQAQQVAGVARSNYDATTAALSRFAADTAPAATPPVNADLVLDWSLLNGTETRTEEREDDIRRDVLRRWALTDTPTGGKVLRMDETTQIMWKKHHVNTIITTVRVNPATGFMLRIEEGQPLYRVIPPGYQSEVRIGPHAFATNMKGPGFDVTVPPGTLSMSLLPPAIAAMPGELPASFRIWVVDTRGEVVPADIEVLAHTTVEDPVGEAGGTCAGTNGLKERREAVTVKVSAGTETATVDVLAAAPHMVVNPEVKCRIIRR
jgi:hypothetical protein